MNPIRKFFGKLFNRKPEPVKVAPPKIEHFTVEAPKPKVTKTFSLLSWLRFRKREEKRKREAGTEKPVSFGTFRRIRHICGHSVRPLKRAQKRDLEKLWGVKLI